MDDKNGKKEMFPWFSMPHKNAHKFLGSKPPKFGSKTGIRFDTKWHHNWLNQLLIWRISIIFRRASFLFSKKNRILGFWDKKRRIGDEFSLPENQFSGKCRKVEFSMPCKMKSAENLHVWPYARCGHPGNPQTSPISTWIVKKPIFVNFRFFQFFDLAGTK